MVYIIFFFNICLNYIYKIELPSQKLTQSRSNVVLNRHGINLINKYIN